MKEKLRNITVSLLGTATVFTVGLPQQAQAASFSYGYAYQQITNLIATVDNPLSLTFGSDTVSNATILQGVTTTPLSLQGDFDVSESYVKPPTSGANLGLGNNFGFFTNPTPPTFSSQKGQVTPNYARGDSQLLGITNTNQIATALFGNGLNFASVAESYLETPTQLAANGFLVNQGNAIGRSLLPSDNFTVTTDTTINFSYFYRNEGFTQLTENTPPGAPIGNQATGKIAFIIAINEVIGNNLEQVYTCNSFTTNNDFGETKTGSSDVGVNEGTVGVDENSVDNCDPFTFNPDKTYRLEFRNEQIVDTRLVQAPPEVPEPSTSIALLGMGFFCLIRLCRKSSSQI